ncbi:MAG: formyltransferase family protein [Alphaproteobacteria bacterium]|jgi:methionyl-tRNA formyltransferase
MNVLCFSPFPERIGDCFLATEDLVEFLCQPPTLEAVSVRGPAIIVNYGCPYIYHSDVLQRYSVINLHISLLPWNRGPHPNLWSWIDGTPKGVTIHYIDDGIDSGDIIAQREVVLDETETLRTCQDRLLCAADRLFAEQWKLIREGRATRREQPLGGSSHCVEDTRLFKARLPPDISLDELAVGRLKLFRSNGKKFG